MPAKSSPTGAARFFWIVALVIFGIGILLFFRCRMPSSRPPVAQRVVSSTTNPSTTASTRPVPEPQTYMQLVIPEHPEFAATRPLAIPLDDYRDAARIVFRDLIYLDPQGELWIRRTGAPSVAALVQQMAAAESQAQARMRQRTRTELLPAPTTAPVDPQCHITREQVVFAYVTEDEQGQRHRQVIVREPDQSGFELINADGRMEIGTRGRRYNWARAEWVPRMRDSAIVVPTDDGVAVFRPQLRPMEIYQSFGASPSTQPVTTNPQFLLDPRGLLAWLPWENGRAGGKGAARYVDGKWVELHESGWQHIIHLVPLLDGTVLVISLAEDGQTARLSNQVLDTPALAGIDEDKVADLAKQLSDREFNTRETAHAELSRYGPQIWPTLEKLRPAQPPEGQARIDQLLQARQQPMLGRMVLQQGKLLVVARFEDGGALLYADAGVVLPGEDPSNPGTLISPAWISIRAGRAIELAPPALVADLDPARAAVSGFSDEWIVTNDVDGPQRFLGNHLEPMLRKSERSDFKRFIGEDQRGRWLFAGKDGKTLVIDPTLPDATPRLPAWHYPVNGGVVGWTQAGWPVVRRGGAWVIDRDGTRPLGPRERMFTDVNDMPAVLLAPGVERAPATTTSSQPTSRPVKQAIGYDSAGGRYFDGRQTLRRIDSDGRVTVWPLPDGSTGTWSHPRLIEAEDRLFLFNEAGRVIRLKRQADHFVIEATFVQNIPSIDEAKRIWLDPAGRIVMSYEGNKLSLLFPAGRIPKTIAQRMLAQDIKANEPE